MIENIATEILYNRNVNLFADTSHASGSFCSNYAVKGVPSLTIGIKTDYWWRVVSILHHEVYEFLMTDLRLRYTVSDEMADNSAAYYFHMDHQEFAELATLAAYFISRVEPALKKAWRRRKHVPKPKQILTSEESK